MDSNDALVFAALQSGNRFMPAPVPQTNMFAYKASNAISGDPGIGYMLWENATQISANHICINNINDSGNDINIFLAALKSGVSLYVQDANDSANFQKWSINGTPAKNTGYWRIPVNFVSSGGAGTTNFPNNHKLFIVTA